MQGAAPQQLGGGWNGVPGWVAVATGEVHLLGAESFWLFGGAGCLFTGCPARVVVQWRT